jgi:SSS family solute:Na+ symporter
MILVDWIVLLGTLIFIAVYGVIKTRGSKNMENYLLGGHKLKWGAVGISIMATQASAITFLSTPGQAYQDGMRFIQIYFGLPLAMVILSITAVPIYNRLKVYTAYEYLETRFDLKTRSLAAILFLLQRGLSTGITIYAPAIILSAIIGLPPNITCIFIGGIVIIYTVAGGSRAVGVTQQFQMFIILGGMFAAGIIALRLLPGNISFVHTIRLAGAMGRMQMVDFSFDMKERYNFWSGIIGGVFLSLSYFGADQSQVGRYLSGESVTESRMGLLLNGLLKIPMQFMILFIGVLVFIFYQFHRPPVFFNSMVTEKVVHSKYAGEYSKIENAHILNFTKKKAAIQSLADAYTNPDKTGIVSSKTALLHYQHESDSIHKDMSTLVAKAVPKADNKDTDYVFITFIMEHIPHGLIGLLIAVMFCAAMSVTAAQLNALASTSCVDIYRRSIKKGASEAHYVAASRWLTVFWGILAIFFALMAAFLDNLIQTVNILGSLFYGSILGIFLAAFYCKYIHSRAVFIAALISEAVVLICYFNITSIAYLWYNAIGCILVIVLAYIIQFVSNNIIRRRNVNIFV